MPLPLKSFPFGLNPRTNNKSVPDRIGEELMQIKSEKRESRPICSIMGFKVRGTGFSIESPI